MEYAHTYVCICIYIYTQTCIHTRLIALIIGITRATLRRKAGMESKEQEQRNYNVNIISTCSSMAKEELQ